MLLDTGPIGVILLTLVSIVRSATELSAEECLALGLNKNFLLCSSCDALKEFNLDTLESGCRSCCTQDDVNSTPSKYPRAQLEVCGWRLGAFPQVQAFVKSDRPSAFPNLTIKYVRGADPVIKLMDEEGEVMETLAIDKWNTDSVEEFLNTYLILPGSVDDEFAAFDRSDNEI